MNAQQRQLRQLDYVGHMLEAIRQLMTPPDPPRQPIGFVTPDGKKEA